MNDNEVNNQDDEHAGLVALAAASVVVGAVTGAIGVLFRFALERADAWRNAFVAWAHAGHDWAIVLVVLAATAAAALAAWLVARFAPMASGSGIPHVEAVLHGRLPPAPLVLIPIKFVGGVLAIGAGLALGREGPTVQMGASIAHAIGTFFRRNVVDCRVLLAAGAGAGLATAFNAPIAGAVFVLEELMRRFDARTAVAALGASASAIAMARLLHGDFPDFHLPAQPFPGFEMTGAHLLLGALLGLLGAAYSRLIVWTLDVADSFGPSGSVKHATMRAAMVGAAVGLLAWFAPDLAGGGDALTERALLGSGTLAGVSRDVRVALRARPGVVRGGRARRHLRADARARRADGPRVRPRVSRLVPRHGARNRRHGHVRGGRHGGVLRRGGARAGHGHRARHRDDGELHPAPADAHRLLHRDGRADAPARAADLRFARRPGGRQALAPASCMREAVAVVSSMDVRCAALHARSAAPTGFIHEDTQWNIDISVLRASGFPY